MDSLFIVGIAFDATFTNPNDINPSCFIASTHNNTHETIRWHHKLAHLNILLMKGIQTKALPFMPIIPNFMHLPLYEGCIMGKHHKILFHPFHMKPHQISSLILCILIFVNSCKFSFSRVPNILFPSLMTIFDTLMFII
jgi:hypothetical protein